MSCVDVVLALIDEFFCRVRNTSVYAQTVMTSGLYADI